VALNRTILWNFRTRLLQPHCIGLSLLQYVFLNHIPLKLLKLSQSRAALLLKGHVSGFDNYFQVAPTDVEETPSISDLLWHLSGAVSTRVGRKENPSKRIMSGGSLTCWGGTSIRFSVQGKGTHCGCCYCSIICSGSYICCSRGDWPFKLIVSVESLQKKSATPHEAIFMFR
jgi:hypothetical protein